MGISQTCISNNNHINYTKTLKENNEVANNKCLSECKIRSHHRERPSKFCQTNFENETENFEKDLKIKKI